MYIKRTWNSRDTRFRIVEKYHSQRALPKNPLVREKRRPRTGAGTPEWLRKANLRQQTDRLCRLLMDNFHVGDWYVTFSAASAKTSKEEVEAAYVKMVRKLRDAYHACGIEWKYVAVLENLNGRGNKHGHILIPGGIAFTELKKLMRKAWPLGAAFAKPYGGDAMDARRLASYFVKEDCYKDSDASDKGQRSRLRTSKNLVRREPKKKVVSAETWREEVRPPKGYHIVLELSYSGYTMDGYPYQRTIFEKDD